MILSIGMRIHSSRFLLAKTEILRKFYIYNCILNQYICRSTHYACLIFNFSCNKIILPPCDICFQSVHKEKTNSTIIFQLWCIFQTKASNQICYQNRSLKWRQASQILNSHGSPTSSGPQSIRNQTILLKNKVICLFKCVHKYSDDKNQM